MPRVRGIVLAAGRGIRMGGRTAKTLNPVRGHEPLLYYVLNGLQKAGVTDLLVVTGFKASEVEDFVGKHWTADVQFVFNARYASWGNFHSLRVALDQSPGLDALVVNSDVIVVPDVYRRVLDKRGDLVLAVEKRTDLDDEDMRVELHGDRVLAIGKHLRRGRGHGEFDGVSLLRSDTARVYLDAATDSEWSATTSAYYEDVYARLLPRVDARAAFVLRGEYAEVDEWPDMEAAGKVIAAHRNAWDAPSRAQPASV